MKYDVQCLACNRTEEISKRMSEDYPPCSKCGEEVKQVFLQAPTFSLLGTGWAAHDCSKKKRGD